MYRRCRKRRGLQERLNPVGELLLGFLAVKELAHNHMQPYFGFLRIATACACSSNALIFSECNAQVAKRSIDPEIGILAHHSACREVLIHGNRDSCARQTSLSHQWQDSQTGKNENNRDSRAAAFETDVVAWTNDNIVITSFRWPANEGKTN